MSNEIMTENVIDIITRYANEIAKHRFNYFLRNVVENIERFSTSPIESMFFSAYILVLEMIQINSANITDIKIPLLVPQLKVGTYKCDFLLIDKTLMVESDEQAKFIPIESDTIFERIIIELDGHNFHDKNEQQRRYEKKRDRYLQSQGFKVLHFTGKEITDDPLRAMYECFIQYFAKNETGLFLMENIFPQYKTN